MLLWERHECESIALGCVSGDTAGFLSMWFPAQSFRKGNAVFLVL